MPPSESTLPPARRRRIALSTARSSLPARPPKTSQPLCSKPQGQRRFVEVIRSSVSIATLVVAHCSLRPPMFVQIGSVWRRLGWIPMPPRFRGGDVGTGGHLHRECVSASTLATSTLGRILRPALCRSPRGAPCLFRHRHQGATRCGL